MSPNNPCNRMFNGHYKLNLFVDSEDPFLQELYYSKINEHNESLKSPPADGQGFFPDSGFDLFLPEEVTIAHNKVNKINFKVKCAMVFVDNNGNEYPVGFYMYARSSISKTNLRLANNVGIIDSGYRGDICGMFDPIYVNSDFKVEKHTRLTQICSPTLEPFFITKVTSDSDLGSTQRGSGGFGSTGQGA